MIISFFIKSILLNIYIENYHTNFVEGWLISLPKFAHGKFAFGKINFCMGKKVALSKLRLYFKKKWVFF